MEMRKSDALRLAGIQATVKRRVDDLSQSTQQISTDSEIRYGMCIVQHAIAYGARGSMCDVEVLIKGQSTGVFYYDTVCYNAVLSIGDVVPFMRLEDSTVELIGGGASTTTTTTTQYGANWMFLANQV